MNVNIISIVLTAVAVGSISYFVVSADRARNHEQIHHEEVTVENPYDMANAEHANANPTAQLTESDIEKIVESYIKTNPTVILKSLEDYYADQAKKASSSTETRAML